MTVHRNCKHGRRKCRELVLCGAPSVLKIYVGRSTPDSMASFGFDPFVVTVVVLLSQEATDPEQKPSTESKRLAKRLGHNNGREPAFISVKEGAKSVLVLTAERDVL